MKEKHAIIINTLVERGKDLLKEPYKEIQFTEIDQANKLLNNLKSYPHAYVLACAMDRQIKAERAWAIPYEISKEINGFEFQKLRNLSAERIRNIFIKRRLHRFNKDMAKYFHLAIQKIQSDYGGYASRIWHGRPRSATVVKRFLKFDGIGVKIATMAANILAREFKVPMEDYVCIDISPDVQVKRVFKRLGFLSKDSYSDELIYCARELNPDYPGIFDLSCWEIGRHWCRPRNPICAECYLNKYCPKML